MDWKKKMEEMKAKAADAKASIDKDGDGTPDAVENVMAKAREAAEAAKAKLGEMKARLDKDGDGTPDAIENLSEEARQAIAQAKAKAAEIAKAAQEKLGKKPADNA